ncbi:MAG TPA: phosphate signaling complex protein PhoU [Candidatus Baltobacteraceae bacterium]|nr:phosphate signaling complex protein PhoU [Candidatus Baltobacteraceae bacterium]
MKAEPSLGAWYTDRKHMRHIVVSCRHGDLIEGITMRTLYHEALESARLDVVRLGVLAGDAIHHAVASLDRRDTDLAARVIAGDDTIDDLRRKVEAACIELLWRQQPVAGDLRAVAAMLEIVVDLERIGDYAVDIAKNAIKLSDVPLRPARVEIGRIAALAIAMLEDGMRAYTERDNELAGYVIDRDDEVDKLYNRGIEALQEEMQADRELVRAGTIILFVLAALERVGDRAQNIAWHTKEMIG